MNILLIGVAIFVLSILVIELFFYAIRIIRQPDQHEVQRRLKIVFTNELDEESEDIVKKRVLSEVPFINRILIAVPWAKSFDLCIKKANLKYTLGFYILLSLFLGFSGYMFSFPFTHERLLSILIAFFLACLPSLFIRHKKNKRMAKFEKQLPEALGLIARALRAGQAFQAGMKLAAEEFEDPLGPELDATLDEINFGLSVADALKNLTRRVDCPDLKFFVVSVIMQRETGGNLAEIIEGLASLIRERFKFRRKVRVLSAEGRLSAVVLVLLPFILFGALCLLNFKFINPLIFDPIGRIVVGSAIALMFFGVIAIKQIVRVDV